MTAKLTYACILCIIIIILIHFYIVNFKFSCVDAVRFELAHITVDCKKLMFEFGLNYYVASIKMFIIARPLRKKEEDHARL